MTQTTDADETLLDEAAAQEIIDLADAGRDADEGGAGESDDDSRGDDPGDDDGPESQSGTASSSSARPSKAAIRALVRRTLLKAAEVEAAPAEIRAAAAALLGSTKSVVDLTTAIMTADRSATQTITDLRTIADAEDPFEAPTIAAALGRERIKAVWILLRALNAAPPGDVPPAIPKAATALARKIFGSRSELTAPLDAVTTLVRKN